MPYEAWMVVAEAMRRAREQGLFGDWVGIIRCGAKKMEQMVGIEPTADCLEGSDSTTELHLHT